MLAVKTKKNPEKHKNYILSYSTMKSLLDLEQTLSIAKKIAQEAGDCILSYYDKEYSVKIKENDTLNVVTQVDKKAEKIILSQLHKNFPTHHFISEETKVPSIPSSAYVWIIDPMDGSRDFVNKTGDFAVQIGLCKNGKILLSVVYLPYYNKMFYACVGKGAFCNDERILISDRKTLSKCIAVVSSRIKIDSEVQKIYKAIPTKKLEIRGSFGLKTCFIANGVYDLVIYKKKSVKIWDVCAPLLILQEAGGMGTLLDGSPIPLNPTILDYSQPIILSNGEIHQQILQILRKKNIGE